MVNSSTEIPASDTLSCKVCKAGFSVGGICLIEERWSYSFDVASGLLKGMVLAGFIYDHGLFSSSLIISKYKLPISVLMSKMEEIHNKNLLVFCSDKILKT